MKRKILPIVYVLFFLSAHAQDKTVREIQEQASRALKKEQADTSIWRKGGTLSINFGQGGSHNWAGGAEKFSLSIASYLSVYAHRRAGIITWDNTLDLGYALVNTTSQGVRKTDDKIDLFSKLSRDLNKRWSVSAVLSLRSQFADGFDYDYLGKGYKRKTSGFLAPAYVVLAPGFDWHPVDYFSIFLSPLSGRMVVVAIDPRSYSFPAGVIPPAAGGGFELPLAALYGVDPARKVRIELGGFASINFTKELVKNVSVKSRLDLYSNYLKTDRFRAVGPDQIEITSVNATPQNVDVYWTNLITMKVNRFLNVTYNFDLIYDDDVRQFGRNKTSPATQWRSLLAVGIAAKF